MNAEGVAGGRLGQPFHEYLAADGKGGGPVGRRAHRAAPRGDAARSPRAPWRQRRRRQQAQDDGADGRLVQHRRRLGTSEQYFDLRASLTRHAAQPDAKRRADAEPLIRRAVTHTGIDRALALDAAHIPFDELLPRVQAFLDDVDRALAPHGSKILGDAPTGKSLADMVTAMAGRDLRTSLEPLTANPSQAARALVAAVVLDGQDPRAALIAALGRTSAAAEAQLMLTRTFAARLQTAPRELEAILETLEGRWIDPGPMDEPVRKPESLPPGRSLYNFDQGAIPTPEAEAIGVRQAEALISAHREHHNSAYPTSLAFVIWSGEIAKNLGVTEAQILHLLGTRPVRDARGTVTGVELIPRAELGRPRVDVLATTSGTYRDHYQDKVELIAEATRMAATSPEPDNPVAAATRATEAKLIAGGETAEKAAALARARVFSPAPGAYSPSIQFLAKSGDQRGDEARMAELYTSRLSHAYGAGLYGEAARPAFEQNLGRVDSATLPRTSHVNGLLDHPMSAGFLGGLNLAARAVTGKDIDLYVSNLRDTNNTSIDPAERALQTELRTRYFNPAWLKQMQTHGYEGARTMMYLTDHLDLWDSTATRMVSSRDWDEVKDVYVEDTLGLDMDAFFDQHNPHARQVLMANLLGAAARGHWEATAADLAEVAGRLARSAAEHGIVCEASVCRNPALAAYVEKSLAGVPGGEALVAGYRSAIQQAVVGPPSGATSASTTAAAAPAPPMSPRAPAPPTSAPATPPAQLSAPAVAAPPMVAGRVMEELVNAPEDGQASGQLATLWTIGVLAALLFAAGWALPTRARR